jgi:hypothetical protein
VDAAGNHPDNEGEVSGVEGETMRTGHNSQPVTEDDIHNVVAFLHEYPDLIAEAKKQSAQTEWLAKILLAELTGMQTGKSHAERESKAILIDTYQKAKQTEINAARNETFVKAKFAANELIASLYQTQSANARSTKV